MVLKTVSYETFTWICLLNLLLSTNLWHWTRRKRWNFVSTWCAPCHFSHEVWSALNVRFSNCVIGRVLPRLWPLQSSDLSLLDFFLWGCIKYIKHKCSSSYYGSASMNMARNWVMSEYLQGYKHCTHWDLLRFACKLYELMNMLLQNPSLSTSLLMQVIVSCI